MNDKDWQARALQESAGWGVHSEHAALAEQFLAFAREYAAEALAEVERLKDEAGQYRAERNDLQSKLNHANDEVTSLRADVGQLEKALRVPGAGFAECLNIVDRLMDESDNRVTYANKLLDDVKSLRAQLAAAGPVWQPIETAPKDGTQVIAAGRNFGASTDWHRVIAEWRENAWVGEDFMMGETYDYLTHWQPLPAPPKENTPAKPPFDAGNFVWSWLMDYCKRRGIAPANQNELFALCNAIRAAMKEND